LGKRVAEITPLFCRECVQVLGWYAGPQSRDETDGSHRLLLSQHRAETAKRTRPRGRVDRLLDLPTAPTGPVQGEPQLYACVQTIEEEAADSFRVTESKHPYIPSRLIEGQLHRLQNARKKVTLEECAP
jgi:hypothetical protein